MTAFFTGNPRFSFFYLHLRAVYESWRFLITFHQLHGLFLAVFIYAMLRLKMNLVMIDSKCSVLLSNIFNSKLNKLSVDFYFIWLYRSRLGLDVSQYSHEINNVEFESSDFSSLFKKHNNDSFIKNRFLNLNIRRLKSTWRKICEYRFVVLFCAELRAIIRMAAGSGLEQTWPFDPTLGSNIWR